MVVYFKCDFFFWTLLICNDKIGNYIIHLFVPTYCKGIKKKITKIHSLWWLFDSSWIAAILTAHWSIQLYKSIWMKRLTTTELIKWIAFFRNVKNKIQQNTIVMKERYRGNLMRSSTSRASDRNDGIFKSTVILKIGTDWRFFNVSVMMHGGG